MVEQHPALQHAIVDMFMMRMPRFSPLDAQYKVFKMMRQGIQLVIFMQWPTETDVVKVLDFFGNFMTISAYKPRAHDQTVALSKQKCYQR